MRKGIRTVFVDAEGRLRASWKLLLGIAVYLAAFYGVLYGLAACFGMLFNAWGLTNDNLFRAPLWAQRVVAWHTDFSYAMAYGASAAAGLLLTRRRRDSEPLMGAPWQGLALGAGLAAMMTIAALAFDSMRMERPLDEPLLRVSQLAAAMVLISGKLSAEVLTKRLLFDRVRRRTVAYAAVCVVTILLMRSWTDLAGAAVAVLLGIVGCALYERGGLLASVGFQTGLSLWFGLIFGWPGMMLATEPVYALYSVSDAWLAGGNAGVLHGWGFAVLLAAIAAAQLRGELVGLKRKKR